MQLFLTCSYSDSIKLRNDAKCRWGQMLEIPPSSKRNFMSSYLKQLLERVSFGKLPCLWFIRHHVHIICEYAISIICFTEITIILPVRVFSSSFSQSELSCLESRKLIDHMGEVSCLSKTSFDRQKARLDSRSCPMVNQGTV